MTRTAEARKCATYCRISYDPRGTEAGVDRQRADTDKLAADLGYTVVDRIVDNDRSASRKARRAREGFDQMLEMAQAGTIDAVVAYDLDRFTRNPDELGAWIDVADKTGIKIHTTGTIVDLADPDSVFTARVLLAVAEKEAANISRRMKRKLQADAEQGKPHWPRRPFGYTLKAEPVPAEARIVNKMIDRVIDGESCTSIANWLNETGIESATGAPWQSSSVKFLVSATRNAGLREYKGEIVGPAAWPAIVTEDRWKAARAALALRARPKRGGKLSLLTGLVRCGRCGGPMYRTGADVKAEYRCLKGDAGRKTAGCGNSMRAHHVDNLVVEMVLVRLGDVVGRKRAARVENGYDALESIRADLDELAEMVGRGELSMSEFKTARAPLQARLRAAEAVTARDDTEAALDRLAGAGTTLADRWDDLDIDHRHRLVRLVLERIDIAPAKVRTLDLDRVEPIWLA
jgi:DNA invertase Pin-like site-specific DNA recombinase